MAISHEAEQDGASRPDRFPSIERRIDFSGLPFSTPEERTKFEREIYKADVFYRANSIISNLEIMDLSNPRVNLHTRLAPISLYNKPKQNHDNSRGFYLGEDEQVIDVEIEEEQVEVTRWWGLYVLMPNGQTTSQHDHPEGVLEDYHLLAGEFKLVVDGKPRIMTARENRARIFPGQDHFGMTGDQFALMLVIMSGIKDGQERHRNSRIPILPLDEAQ